MSTGLPRKVLETDLVSVKHLDGLNTYLQLAKDGFSQAEVCRELGVSYQNVQTIAKKHKIKFADGRTKEPLEAPDLPKN